MLVFKALDKIRKGRGRGELEGVREGEGGGRGGRGEKEKIRIDENRTRNRTQSCKTSEIMEMSKVHQMGVFDIPVLFYSSQNVKSY